MSEQAEQTVGHPHTHPRPAAAALLAFVVLAAALAAELAMFLPVRVEIDGRSVTVQSGWSAERVGAAPELSALRGDLVSVRGLVLGVGLGGPARLVVSGRELAPRERVRSGSRLESRRGLPRVESVVTSVVTLPAPDTVEGTGPLATVVSEGSPGIARARVGALSGEVVTVTKMLVEPVPRIVRRGGFPSGAKLAALTFDDGPWRGQTDKVLRILADQDAKATFFMLGLRVRVDPDLARRVVAEGHEVGNHSMRHRYLKHAGAGLARAEIGQAQRLIVRTTGVTPRRYRPAGGLYNSTVARESRRLGMAVVRWDVDSADYRRLPAAKLAARVLKGVGRRQRVVILLHDGGGDRIQTIRALPSIISGLKARGYHLVTMDQMAAAGR